MHAPRFHEFSQEWKNIGRNDEDGRKALIEKQCMATKEKQKVNDPPPHLTSHELHLSSLEIGLETI